MSLLLMLAVLIVVGISLWAINNYIPMDPKIKNILNVATVILTVLWLLRASGVLGWLGTVKF